MNSPTVITRSGWRLAITGILMCGLVACSDEADSPQEAATESVEQTHEMEESTPDSERSASFSQPEVAEDYAAAWPYDFDFGPERLETTVLALGDVWFESDGTFGLEPTPYQNVSGEEFGGEWTYELIPRSFGRMDHAEELTQPIEAIHRPSKASFEYTEGARVDYEHHHDGMKLFVHIDERPAGDGPVRVEFEQNERNLDYRPTDDGMHVYHNGDEAFRWMGLIAFDAKGTSLPVSMVTSGDSLYFEVDDTNAVYPLTVDPLATTPDWTFSGSQSGSNFGNRIVSGDVNNNGHTDILISDPLYTGDESFQGRVLLFLGSSDGFLSTADLIIAGDTAFEQLGVGTDMNGDFSGDGCAEIIVGAPGYDGFGGRALHYQPFDCTQSDPELNAQLKGSREGNPDQNEIYGRAVSTGDFNCNGDVDILVSGPNRTSEDDNGNSISLAGGVDIYFNESSLETPFGDDPGFVYEGGAEDIRLGWTNVAIPEVDGTTFTTPERCDGFAAGSRNQNDNRGAAYIFHHNEDGDIVTPPTIIDGEEEGYEAGAAFGSTLSTMPSPEGNEINGHELSGIVVGAETLGTDELPGYVSIYEYSESSGTFEEVWHVEGPHDGSNFGSSIGGRVDFNGDGHHDLVIGAPHYDANTDEGDEGGAFVYLGTDEGLQDEPEMILDSGQSGSEFGYDVTGIRDFGDDKDALIVGARRYDGFVEDGGRVFVYPGQENCYIDDVFYSAGTENPDNLCEVCNPEVNTSDWSDNEDGIVCDDGDDCTISACEDGQCVEQSGVDCDDGNPCTDNICDDGACINPPANGGIVCDDDGISCTEHTCDDGECVQSIESGTCYIDNTCHDDETVNPGADCLKCDVSVSQDSWSPRDAGIECDNGLFCTVNDECDGAGQCQAGDPRECELPDCWEEVTCSNAASQCILQGPLTGEPCDPEDGLGDCTAGTCDSGNCIGDHVQGCIIDGQCIDSGTSHADDDCLVCAPEQNETGWTIASDNCFIDGNCYGGGNTNPNNDCEICTPMEDNTSWSHISAGTSCDPGDGLDCTDGECDGDGNCDVEIDAGTCVIDDQCIDQETVNPDNECEICDPSEDPTAYSANAGADCGGPGCTADDELIVASVCDESGVCEVDEVIECDPYVCDDEELACTEECEDDEDCAGDAHCVEDEGECSLQPVADAGTDQLVSPDDEVTLDGTASFAPSGEELNFQWEQLDGEEVELSDSEVAAPTFIAPRPEPIDEDLELVFGLVVDDGELLSDPDTTTVVVSADADDNEAPVAVIIGSDEAAPGDVIELDGTESWDPDGDPIVNYNWSHVGGSPAPDVDEIEDDDGLHTTAEVAIPEEVDSDTVYEIGLIVSDGLANSPQEVHDIVVEVTEPSDDIGVDPDTGIPDAGHPPEGEEALGEVGGSGCVCSSTYGGERDTQGMVVFLLVLGFALWRRRRVQ